MKVNLQTIHIAIATIFVLSACGGGSSAKQAVVTETNIAQCSENKTTSLKKDDRLTALTDDTEIRVTHTQDGTKVACVDSGNAKVN